MSRKVAILITNYNMPERTDALCDTIRQNVFWPHDLIVVDNGSDLCPPSQYTTLRLGKNIQTTGGWLAGLKEADRLTLNMDRRVDLKNIDYFAYWFLITSAAFPSGKVDPLTPLVEALIDNPGVVGVHPSLTEDSTTAWEHLKKRNGGGLRPVWMIDNIASLWRADWFNGIGRFDARLVYGWGIDLETCWFARKQGFGLCVHEDVEVRKVTDIGYSMGRMNMSAEDRRKLAGENMANILSAKYGPDWNSRMRQEFVTHDMV